MEQFEKMTIRRLQRLVEEETDDARHKFDMAGQNLEEVDLSLGFMAFEEESGKLCRTFNKLRIANSPESIKEWEIERDRRFVTTFSLLERLYLETRKRDI